jgi:hypothetical protein
MTWLTALIAVALVVALAATTGVKPRGPVTSRVRAHDRGSRGAPDHDHHFPLFCPPGPLRRMSAPHAQHSRDGS